MEFYLKMKNEYSANHPSHIKIRMIFNSHNDGLLLFLCIFHSMVKNINGKKLRV